jgi:16S rRNA processing protein RimM
LDKIPDQKIIGLVGEINLELVSLQRQMEKITEKSKIPLEEGEFYLYQAIGLAVYTDEGEHLGQIAEIIETGANDVYVVHGPRGEVLLPDIEECVLEIDLDAKKMTVHLIDGLLPD